MERWQSGRLQLPAKQLTWQRVLGFKSRPLRHFGFAKMARLANHLKFLKVGGPSGFVRFKVLSQFFLLGSPLSSTSSKYSVSFSDSVSKYRLMNKKFPTIIILSLLSLTFHSYVFAQNLPPGTEPGAQAERFKAKAMRQQKRFEKKIKPSPIEIQPAETKPTPKGPTFELKEIIIAGNTAFNLKTLRPIYEFFLNKTVSFEDLNTIAKKIEEQYKRKGYLTTKVYIPKQDIIDGKVMIQVDEGKMGKLHIEGNKYFSTAFIEKYFHAKNNEIFNVKKLQRDILRLNKNQDLEVKTVIERGQEPQTSDITLKVADKFPWHRGIGFDNQGTRLTGKYRSSAYLRSSNATGRGDTVFLSSIFSSLTSGQSFNYAAPIGTYGTKFAFDVIYFNMKIGKEFKPLDITGNTQIYTPHMLWELALTENFTANADAGIDIKSITKHTSGERSSDDQLRIPFFGFQFTKTDPYGQTSLSPKFSFSTANFLGASSLNHPSASRSDTGGFFFKYEQDFNRMQRMPLDSYLSIRSQLQLASHTLPSSEQFQLGGANSIRGYPEGDYLADQGGSLNLDWIMPMYFIPKSWHMKGSDTDLRHQIEPVLFADVGGGDLRKVLPGESNHKFLAGVGGGLRFHFNDYFYLRLDWARRVADRTISGSGPSNFYVTFQMQL